MSRFPQINTGLKSQKQEGLILITSMFGFPETLRSTETVSSSIIWIPIINELKNQTAVSEAVLYLVEPSTNQNTT